MMIGSVAVTTPEPSAGLVFGTGDPSLATAASGT